MWFHILNALRLGFTVTWLRFKYRFLMWQGKVYEFYVHANYQTNAINVYYKPKRTIKYISLRFVTTKDGVSFEEAVNGDETRRD